MQPDSLRLHIICNGRDLSGHYKYCTSYMLKLGNDIVSSLEYYQDLVGYATEEPVCLSLRPTLP